jgi:3-isopropylmalate dehydrogenase
MTKQILILPGDGIGKEVTTSAIEVLDYLQASNDLDFNVLERDVGGTSYDLYGKPLTEETLEIAKKFRCSIIWSSRRSPVGESWLGSST